MSRDNVYDDLSNDLKNMIDEYTGPRPPEGLDMAKEVFLECMCGGLDCNYAKNSCTWCSHNRYNICKCVGIVFGLSVIVGLGYLFLFPFNSMWIGIMFKDYKCDWYGYCHTYALNTQGNCYSPKSWCDGDNSDSVSSAMAAVGLSLSSLIFPSVLLLLMVIVFRQTLIRSEKIDIGIGMCFTFYIGFVLFMCVAFHFHLAKYFGAYHNPKECSKFVELPFVYWYYKMHHPGNDDDPYGYDGVCGYSDCCPFQSNGFMKGVKYNQSLPWDVETCTKCKEYGWNYLAAFLVPPVIITFAIWLTFLIIRRCYRKVQKVNRKYYIRV